ncbi:hypothetical protein ACB092_02G043500 [Castanea dentata]
MGELRKHFYKHSCPLAEDIVKEIIWKCVASNSTLPAKFLRIHFHDCFVNGCNASVFLDSTTNNQVEKAATPNLSLGGIDVIDEVKIELEKTCPGVVSCANIIALAARDSVSYQRPLWEVLIGRRDGSISHISNALNNIPSPSFNFSILKQSFANKSLTVHDLVVLSSGHTIGIGHCNFFSQRLYKFTGRKNDADPSLNSTYATFLKIQCKSLSNKITILNQCLFQFDAALLINNKATSTVNELLDSQDLFTEFGQSMKRIGAIGVLTGSSGEIRKKCNMVNS